jgi:hypothetical protein
MAPATANGAAKTNTETATTDISPTTSNVDSESQNFNNYGNMSDDKPSRMTRLRRHMAQDVHEDWTDVILVILSFITGMVDAAVFNTWSCFVGMQTGKHELSLRNSPRVTNSNQATRSTWDLAYLASHTVNHTDGRNQAQPSRLSASAAMSGHGYHAK